jgi:hypothetical protein
MEVHMASTSTVVAAPIARPRPLLAIGVGGLIVPILDLAYAIIV